MKRSRSAANHALLVGRRRENTRHRLVNLEGARGFFSGRVLDYLTPCTASAGRTCQIVADISLWNEFLLPMDLELRELPRPERQLALESVFHALHWQEWRDETDRLKYRKAATALYWLLKTHHCVATICIPRTMSDFSISLLCEALHGSTSIKSVTLGDWCNRTIPERIWNLVLCMKHLEKLECPYQIREYSGRISAVLQTTQTLTVLHLCGMDESLSQPFLAALKANTTLRVLSVGSTAIKGDPDLFGEILIDSNTLQDLTVKWGPYCHPNEVKSVFRGMLKNKSIRSLRIDSIVLDVESVELAAKVFTENKALRRFHWCLYSLYPTFMPFSMDGASAISPIPVPANTVVWQEAIAHNSALEDLELPFNTWCAEHWESFFGVLSTHATLKTITIAAGVEQCNVLSPVVKALERTGTADKVSLIAPGEANILALPGGNCCSKLYTNLWDSEEHGVLPVLQQLSTFSHLKELSVKFRFWENECCPAVLEYIAATSTLQKLDMDIRVVEDPLESVQWLQALSRSLLLNRSITELGIFGYFEIGEGLGELGETVSRSSTIRKFCLQSYPGNVALEAFIRGLRVNIFDNYALCSVMFGIQPLSEDLAADWFDVTDTARRNYGLVVRAARFLKDMRPDRSCAAALETVSRHPALVAELAEVLSIGVEEASAMVRQRLQKMQGLHEYMRLAGVVRAWVTCQPREDGSNQLDTLDDYSWRHVRRYLHLDDVIGDLTSPVIP